MTTEIIETEAQEISIIRAPEKVLEEAGRAAKALKDVVSKKARPVIINSEQYLEFEDWQTLGQFYGFSVKTGKAIPVEVNGISGAKAEAELITRDGVIVGGAEAYCMADEKNWDNKPWFQLASMAQTRAGAKALRNRLAWVVVLAGYRATPAEEMQSSEKVTNGVISPAQAKRFYAISKTAGYSDDQIKAWLKEKYQITSTADIKRSYYEDLCHDFEKGLVTK